MGGTLTMIKYVLEGFPIYWLSLDHIPVSILHTLRKRMFNFLWSENVVKEKFHLDNWESIARPKLLGGWGLKSIFLFGKALATKILWRGLFGHGL